MNMIVAVDKNWGIGKQNKLLFNIPEDLKYFKEMTLNKIVVMGKNTLLSLPNSKPLKNRVNIVLSSTLERDDCLIVRSFDELLRVLQNYDKQDIFIIGGAQLYQTMLEHCKNIYVTKINSTKDADTFFENLDQNKNFYQKIKGKPQITKSGAEISFNLYENKNKVDNAQ